MEANRPTTCRVSRDGGSPEIHFGRREVSALLADGGFFWLDLDRPRPEDFEILREAFGFHPLAIEDSEHFEQRAKIDDYDDFVFLVVYGASADGDKLVEVHCFYSDRFLVTVHRDDCDAFATLRGGLAQLPGLAEEDGHYFRDVYDHLIRISDLIDGLEPAECSDEAAGRDRDHLSAVGLADRLLRPELRLAHRADRALAGVRRRGYRD